MNLKDECKAGDLVMFKLNGEQFMGTIEHWNREDSILMIRYADGPESDGWELDSIVDLHDSAVVIICNMGNYDHIVTQRVIDKLVKI